MEGFAPELLADANDADLPPGHEDVSEMMNSSPGSSGGNSTLFPPFQDDSMEGADTATVPPTHPFGDDTLGTGVHGVSGFS